MGENYDTSTFKLELEFFDVDGTPIPESPESSLSPPPPTNTPVDTQQPTPIPVDSLQMTPNDNILNFENILNREFVKNGFTCTCTCNCNCYYICKEEMKEMKLEILQKIEELTIQFNSFSNHLTLL